MIGSREALHHSSTGEQRIEQAAKATGTINTITTVPRDLIASGRVSTHMRKRSFHSSSIVGTKGNSVDILDNKVTSIGITNDERKTKIIKSASERESSQRRHRGTDRLPSSMVRDRSTSPIWLQRC